MTAAEAREKRRAAGALVRRLRDRDAALASGDGNAPDCEPFAAEFMAALWGQGWRPVEALRPANWRLKPQGSEPPEAYREARALVDQRAAIAVANHDQPRQEAGDDDQRGTRDGHVDPMTPPVPASQEGPSS